MGAVDRYVEMRQRHAAGREHSKLQDRPHGIQIVQKPRDEDDRRHAKHDRKGLVLDAAHLRREIGDGDHGENERQVNSNSAQARNGRAVLAVPARLIQELEAFSQPPESSGGMQADEEGQQEDRQGEEKI